jgi:hypothetical protein
MKETKLKYSICPPPPPPQVTHATKISSLPKYGVMEWSKKHLFLGMLRHDTSRRT